MPPDDGVTIKQCFQTHSLEMLAVGVPLSTLTAMGECSTQSYAQPPASPASLRAETGGAGTAQQPNSTDVAVYSSAPRAGARSVLLLLAVLAAAAA